MAQITVKSAKTLIKGKGIRIKQKIIAFDYHFETSNDGNEFIVYEQVTVATVSVKLYSIPLVS